MTPEKVHDDPFKDIVEIGLMDAREVEELAEMASRGETDKDPFSQWYMDRTSRQQGRMTGQVHTPAPIAYLMAKMALTNDVARALDPACGCGTFLRALRLVLEGRGHGGSLALEGFETQAVPVLLARASLSSLDNGNVKVTTSIHHLDFFDMEPVGDFDLVIGNPPYIRQEALSTGATVRKTLMDRYGKCVMSKRSDLYAYFIEHGTRALRDGGRLVLIIPDKWMDVGYGDNMKRFLLDNYKLDVVLSFGSNVFSRANVDTVVIGFTRCYDARERKRSRARFVRLRGMMPLKDILKLVAGVTDQNMGAEVVDVKEGDLDPRGRWSLLLKAPKAYKDLLHKGRLIRLADVEGVEIRRGVTTNLTGFFFPSKIDLEKNRIPRAFLRPALKSPKGHSGLVLDKAPDYLLDVPEVVKDEELGARQRIIDWGDLPKWGKNGDKKVRDLPSFRKKGDNWFCIGPLAPGQIVVPKFVRGGRPRFIWNKAGAIVSDTFQTIRLHEECDPRVLLGCLNSVIGALSCELMGRVEGRGLLQLITYEIGELLVPDPAKLTPIQRSCIVEGYDAMLKGKGTKSLDLAVVKTLTKGGWKGLYEELVEAYGIVNEERLARQQTSSPISLDRNPE